MNFHFELEGVSGGQKDVDDKWGNKESNGRVGLSSQYVFALARERVETRRSSSLQDVETIKVRYVTKTARS